MVREAISNSSSATVMFSHIARFSRGLMVALLSRSLTMNVRIHGVSTLSISENTILS